MTPIQRLSLPEQAASQAEFIVRAAPDHHAMIPGEANQLRPRAFEYYEFLNSLTPKSTVG